jgi:hypothetical protein
MSLKKSPVWPAAAVVVILVAAGLGGADEIGGAAEMVLPGGKTGGVPFPHRQHQQTVGDCMACHDLFPQETGAISDAIDAGRLKKKQVMNQKCTMCHRQLKREKKPSGPTSCKQCHSVKG